MIKISINDDLYPNLLRKIPNPPLVLYVIGNVDLLNSPAISIVGSRNCSQNGISLAKKFATELSMCGLTIVSGLAKGIDYYSHLYSYNQKGKTIAVLGGGLDNIFPPENIELYNKIIDNNGLVISEYSPSKKPCSKNFLERNRIVSGLSLGTLVIEAKYRSGTSVTAKIAEKQGKKVFTLPHEISDPCGVGTNRLLKKGANLVTSTLDILNALHLDNFKTNYTELNIKEQNSSDIRLNASNQTSESCVNSKINCLSEKDLEIYNIIKNSPTPLNINEIVQNSNYSITDVMSIIFSLEIDEYIKKVETGFVII